MERRRFGPEYGFSGTAQHAGTWHGREIGEKALTEIVRIAGKAYDPPPSGRHGNYGRCRSLLSMPQAGDQTKRGGLWTRQRRDQQRVEDRCSGGWIQADPADMRSPSKPAASWNPAKQAMFYNTCAFNGDSARERHSTPEASSVSTTKAISVVAGSCGLCWV